MNKILTLLSTLLVASALVACSDGNGTAQVQAVANNTVVPASPTTTASVVNTTFDYPAGVPSFGTTATTTLVFTNTTTTPAFSIASGGNTATGTTTFGSCHFLITNSTFVAPSPLALPLGAGATITITVDPCNLTINNQGQLANGQGQPQSATFTLGSASSSGETVTVVIDPSGNISINGVPSGTVTLKPVTGTS